MKKRRSFWKYNIDNWPGFLALAFILFIGTYAVINNVGIIILLMGVSLAVLVYKSYTDWQENG